jgi:hypothetical protein
MEMNRTRENPPRRMGYLDRTLSLDPELLRQLTFDITNRHERRCNPRLNPYR